MSDRNGQTTVSTGLGFLLFLILVTIWIVAGNLSERNDRFEEKLDTLIEQNREIIQESSDRS